MKDKIISILVAVLVIFAFFSSSLWTKVRNLEKNKKEAELKEQLPQQQELRPEKPQVLGTEDQAEIVKDPLAVKSSVDAKVTIVEFSEYLCPYCKRYVDETYIKIMADYGDKIRYIFRDFPIHGEKAIQIAQGAYCAGDQGKYWEYHDLLFEKQKELYKAESLKETLCSFALELGLDESRFNSCLESNKFTKVIDNNFQLGQKVGVSGTPSFFINGKLLVGAQPYESFKVLIESELDK